MAWCKIGDKVLIEAEVVKYDPEDDTAKVCTREEEEPCGEAEFWVSERLARLIDNRPFRVRRKSDGKYVSGYVAPGGPDEPEIEVVDENGMDTHTEVDLGYEYPACWRAAFEADPAYEVVPFDPDTDDQVMESTLSDEDRELLRVLREGSFADAIAAFGRLRQ